MASHWLPHRPFAQVPQQFYLLYSAASSFPQNHYSCTSSFLSYFIFITYLLDIFMLVSHCECSARNPLYEMHQTLWCEYWHRDCTAQYFDSPIELRPGSTITDRLPLHSLHLRPFSVSSLLFFLPTFIDICYSESTIPLCCPFFEISG